MIINSATTRKYLKNTSQAILDARKLLYTEKEMQIGIDMVYKELQPDFKGKFFLINSDFDDGTKMITCQCYIDEVIKPFIKKLNSELNWSLKIN